jgi:hypothetical protein
MSTGGPRVVRGPQRDPEEVLQEARLWRAFLHMWNLNPDRVLHDLALSKHHNPKKFKNFVTTYAGDLGEEL